MFRSVAARRIASGSSQKGLLGVMGSLRGRTSTIAHQQQQQQQQLRGYSWTPTRLSSAEGRRDNGCSETNWADDDLDGMDLSGITFIHKKSTPEELERKRKTRQFISALFTVPTDQEAVDMIWAAVAIHKTLKPHHLAAMVNEAKRQKYAWLRHREGDLAAGDTAGRSGHSADGSDAAVLSLRERRQQRLLREERAAAQSSAKGSGAGNNGDDDDLLPCPPVYPLTRAVLCYTTALEAGFVKLVTASEYESALARQADSIDGDGEAEDQLLEELSQSAAESARVIVGRHVEGLAKLLLEDVLREKFKQWDDDSDSTSAGKKAKPAAARSDRRISTGEYDGVEGEADSSSCTNSPRTKDDASAAWSLVGSMGRYGLALSSPKVLDALEAMLSAGVNDRLQYIDDCGGVGEGSAGACPELAKHKRQSYKLAVANRAEFLFEQRERIMASAPSSSSSSSSAGRRERDREASSRRV